MADSKANISTRLKMVRLELGLSSGEFALKSNIDPRNYSSIETGKRTVGERVLKDICAAFPINLSWLLTGEGEMLKSDGNTPRAIEPAGLQIERLLVIIESQQRTIENLSRKL